MTAIQTPSGEMSPATGRPLTDSSSDSETLLERAKRIAPIIREHADGAERERRLAKPVLDALRAGGFQQMMAPKSLGGLEVDPVTCFRVVEEVARSDSAAAWSLQSGNVNYYWSARLPEAGVEEIYGSHSSAERVGAQQNVRRMADVSGGKASFNVPSRKQPLRAVQFDAGGRLWIERSVTDGAEREADVYDSTGGLSERRRWPADISFAGGYLGSDVAVGVRTDSLGVQQVVRVRFARIGPH